jgi:hypothetical protein
MEFVTMSITKKIPHHLTPTCHVRISWNKIPWFWRLELANTTIKPNIMPNGCNPFVWNVPLVQLKAMLNKFRLMLAVIGDIKMILCQNLGILIINIKFKVRLICNMNQNTNLVGMPVHALQFILHLETVIFNKIHCRNYGIFWKQLHTSLKMFLLPPSNKIMFHKML